ncbi:MAG: Fe(3+) dicitrate transport protein, partial [Verrucomicrobiota bacterium]
EFENRTENVNIAGSSTLFFVQNTGNTRHRGVEAEFSYDLLAPFQTDLTAASVTSDPKSGKDVSVAPEPRRPLQLIVFSNFQYLDAEFTESELLVPGTTRTFVGNTPNYAPDFIWKGGITFQKEKCFRLTFSGVHVSDQFWADNNLGNPAVPTVASPSLVPAVIPAYTVFNFSSEWYLTKNVRLIAGVSNLADEKYYSRVFLNGLIEPAPRRTGYAGVSVEF